MKGAGATNTASLDPQRVAALYASQEAQGMKTPKVKPSPKPGPSASILGAAIGLTGAAGVVSAATWFIATVAPVDDMPAGSRVVIQVVMVMLGAGAMWVGGMVGRLEGKR